MVKSDLIATLSAKMNNVPEKTIADSVNHLLTLLSHALASNQRIEIRDFGSFSLHYHPPRNAHNPKTGVRVITKGKYVPHFKPGKALRERVNASKDQYPIEE